MTEAEILRLIHGGENICVEFKKSTQEITKDVYDTVCSFSNRNGGHIFLGVNDEGTILGISPNSIERLKKDFVTSINNGQKINPPLYLQPEEFEINGLLILVIHVPVSSQVCRHNGKIFDRNNESDINITDNSDMVYQLYARKSSSYFVNKVTRFQLEDLRSDLVDRARAMTTIRSANHPWKSMNDEELLRSAGLILKDESTRDEGITIAAILLFGKDSTIMSVLPQHKTDAIFRVENLDRYDDRDVIITNLLETYDRLIDFGHKHLSDSFILDGIYSVNARDMILREIFSNSLSHRDYSSGYVAKFVIEKDRIYTENANRSHGHGTLSLSNFEPYAKNPPISKVFREISLADELGSGMRNTYKYTKMYSGGIPEFIEGDVFRTIIPLLPVSTGKVGPDRSLNLQDNLQVNLQDNPQVNPQVNIEELILQFCRTPRSRKEITEYCGYKDVWSFAVRYLHPLIKSGQLLMTVPDKPRSRNQKYITIPKDNRQ